MRRPALVTAGKLLAVLLLASLAFYWGLRTGYESARPWELTDYGDLDAAQMSWVIEGIQERIADLKDRLARAIEAQRQKLDAAGVLWRDLTQTARAAARPPPQNNGIPAPKSAGIFDYILTTQTRPKWSILVLFSTCAPGGGGPPAGARKKVKALRP